MKKITVLLLALFSSSGCAIANSVNPEMPPSAFKKVMLVTASAGSIYTVFKTGIPYAAASLDYLRGLSRNMREGLLWLLIDGPSVDRAEFAQRANCYIPWVINDARYALETALVAGLLTFASYHVVKATINVLIDTAQEDGEESPPTQSLQPNYAKDFTL